MNVSNGHPKASVIGRPRETWRRTVEKERVQLGFGTWREAETAAKDRAAWRKRIKGPIIFSTRRERNDDDVD